MGDTLICVICNKSSGKIILFSDETLKKCEFILKLRKKHNLKYNNIILLREYTESGYHRECYKSFTGLMKKYFTPEPENSKMIVEKEQEKETSKDVNTSTNSSKPGSASQSTEPQPSQAAVDIRGLEEVSENANAATEVNSSIQSDTSVDISKKVCLFCNKKKRQVRSKMLPLHEGDKTQFQSRIMSSIENQKENNELLSRLESIASPKIYYHIECRIQFNNKISSSAKKSVKSDWHHHREYHQEAFNEICSIIEEDIINKGRCHLLIYLHELYTDSLERIYAENSIEMDTNFTAHHLKEKIDKKFSKDVKFFTIHNKNIIAPNYMKTIDGTVLDSLKSENIIQKAALTLRKTILTMDKKKLQLLYFNSTSTTQHAPSSSQEHQDPNAGCSNIQKVEPGEDIPLELEVFEESNIEESKNKIDDATENTISLVEIDEGDIEKPKTGNSRKRTRKPQSGDKTATRKLRPDIGGMKINFNNVDKFGEQITFLLKRLPRQLCRELQDTIVTLVKTATDKHENKTKKNVTASGSSSTKKAKTAIPQPEISPTLENNTKHKKRKQLAISEKAIPVLPDVIMGEYTPDETTQVTQLLETQLGTTPDQRFPSRIQTINTFPKPMAVPIELIGSMDYVKQEVLDPEESCSDVTAQEKHNEAKTTEPTLFDPFTTDIKIEIEETNLIEQAKRRENSQDEYD